MVIVTKTAKLMSLSARGKFGFTAGCGFARCGYSRCGASKLYGGIYQKKRTFVGTRISRERYYRPTNPQTEAQQSWRGVLADGWVEYATLTTDERVLLSKQARPLRLSGPQLFMRRWLLAHREMS